MSRIKFDHTFTFDLNHRFHKKLERLGFALSPREVTHPGGHICRFILFQTNLSQLTTYLEFIDIQKGGKPIKTPGLSLRYLGKLEKLASKIDKTLKPKFTHRNYDWKITTKARLPGWNFLDFSKPGFKGINTWITEYEKRPKPHEVEMTPSKHPNGVKNILGIELEVKQKGLRFYQILFGRKIEKKVNLPGNQFLFFKIGKKNKIKSVILTAKSIKTMEDKYPVDKVIQWQNHRALFIKNPADTWDLIIIDERDRASHIGT